MASIQVVFATETASLRLGDGAMMVVQKGSHWPANDPVVKQFPNHFSADPRYGLKWTGDAPAYMALPPNVPLTSESEVETTTAGPGERRNIRRG
jgi:hypothetical protein